jgi:chemotaxis protein CheZ
VQRKIFRVERMFGARMAVHARAERTDAAGGGMPALEQELTLLRDSIARNKRELSALIGEERERRLAHAAGKLGAAVEGMEKATLNILKSTEAIDDAAKALAAVSKTDCDRGLAHDIHDPVVTIYEACNFEDLASQRIASVIAILNTIEHHVTGILSRGASQSGDAAAQPFSGDQLLNGPRLEGASGHIRQSDIDILFD